MRKLSLSNKKPRGIKRQLRNLTRWANRFAAWPAEIDPERTFVHWKIPVSLNLVEGVHAKRPVQRKVVQALIDACSHLMAVKPSAANCYRVTCAVCIPDMFMSEICLFLQEDYFQSHITPAGNEYGTSTRIFNRSLAKEWNLQLPEGMHEVGMHDDYRGFPDKTDWYVRDRWYFGEVAL